MQHQMLSKRIDILLSCNFRLITVQAFVHMHVESKCILAFLALWLLENNLWGGAERKYAKSLAKLVECVQQCCIHKRTKQNQRKAKYVRLRCTISMTTVVSEIAQA